MGLDMVQPLERRLTPISLTALPEPRAIRKEAEPRCSQQGVADEQRRQAEPYEVRLALVGLRSPNHCDVGCIRRLSVTQERIPMATEDSEKNATNPGSVHVIEYYLENGLFSLRWLLVPLYVGLGLLLILFSVYFFRELLRLFAHAATGEEVDLILGALTLVDLTLVGSLIVMVMLSGYENFVSK